MKNGHSIRLNMLAVTCTLLLCTSNPTPPDYGLPSAPSLLSPADTSRNVLQSDLLSWTGTNDGSVTYEIQVATAPDFDPVTVDWNNVSVTSYPLNSLTVNTTYYWHVRAINYIGSSSWSATYQFTLLPTGKYVTINKLYWTYQNAADDYNGSQFNLGLRVELFYAGSSLNLTDIDSVNFSSSGLTWGFNLTNDNFKDSIQCIGFGFNQFYSLNLSPNGSVMPIGAFNFEIKLKDGNVAKLQKDLPAPGSLQSNGYEFIYTEDYKDSKDSRFTPMLKRAIPRSLTVQADTTKITFVIKDTLAYGGWAWLYDSLGDYVGASGYFRNYTTKVNSITINNGSGLYTDSSLNTLTLTSDNCTFEPGYGLNAIYKARIVLTDGKQYADTQGYYDCQSVSSLISK